MVKSISQNSDGSKDFWQECRIKEIVSGKIDQCLVENPTCNSFFHFGAAIFCKHPLRNQFTKYDLEKPTPSIFAGFDNNFANM